VEQCLLLNGPSLVEKRHTRRTLSIKEERGNRNTPEKMELGLLRFKEWLWTGPEKKDDKQARTPGRNVDGDPEGREIRGGSFSSKQ